MRTFAEVHQIAKYEIQKATLAYPVALLVGSEKRAIYRDEMRKLFPVLFYGDLNNVDDFSLRTASQKLIEAVDAGTPHLLFGVETIFLSKSLGGHMLMVGKCGETVPLPDSMFRADWLDLLSSKEVAESFSSNREISPISEIQAVLEQPLNSLKSRLFTLFKPLSKWFRNR